MTRFDRFLVIALAVASALGAAALAAGPVQAKPANPICFEGSQCLGFGCAYHETWWCRSEPSQGTCKTFGDGPSCEPT